MHPEAHEGFGLVLERSGVDRLAPWRVLDLGGLNVNGTVYDWLPGAKITVLDIREAPGVDIVADARTWEPDQQFDLVISTECLEHVSDWPQIIATSAKALDPAGPGLFVLTAASDGRQAHGQYGAPAPARGEHYRNVSPKELRATLRSYYQTVDIIYRHPPGDVYAASQARPMFDITVVIPTIPSRAGMLAQALDSVAEQDLQATEVIVEVGPGDGAAATRNRALERVQTEWTAFLDDDDLLLPEHLLRLAQGQLSSGADLVWPWFTVQGGGDPFPQHFGRQWDPADPHQFPITYLVRTEALRAVGGFRAGQDRAPDGHPIAGEDWQLQLALSAAGYRFHHIPERTWVWRHHGKNTSGLPAQ